MAHTLRDGTPNTWPVDSCFSSLRFTTHLILASRSSIEIRSKCPQTTKLATLFGAVRRKHYDEHTANVQKKFQLPDWPKE
ncbi:hypothetical protein Pla100_47620 [Neorhodopirellula pilleata]|uniref:Uncharacterized protein n=1 Tax=Neorhodopirellula pilleata TaxID=2714738 RepID=A0A5C5ZYT8_9BACT|nr:hypothetical protein Pla100_47620 [Neorhodopirellula pilleata]